VTWSVRLMALRLVLSGCEAGGGSERWELSDGTVLELELGEPAQRETGDARVLWGLESGLTVTGQELAADVRSPEGRRTARAVATALVERVELGEQRGELSSSPCRVGAVAGECVSGWMEHDGRRFSRRGVVLEAGELIVWLDVSAPVARRREVDARWRGIARTLRTERSGDGRS